MHAAAGRREQPRSTHGWRRLCVCPRSTVAGQNIVEGFVYTLAKSQWDQVLKIATLRAKLRTCMETAKNCANSEHQVLIKQSAFQQETLEQLVQLATAKNNADKDEGDAAAYSLYLKIKPLAALLAAKNAHIHASLFVYQVRLITHVVQYLLFRRRSL